MTKRLIVILFMLAFAQTACASQLTEARLALAKWGFVHCLHTHSKDASTKYQAGLSAGGYFQLGSHDDPAAYANVKRYVMEKYPLFVGSAQETNEEMTLSACLNLYSSQGYSKFIKTQDKFVGK